MAKPKKAKVLSSDLEKMWPWGKAEVGGWHNVREWVFDWGDRDHKIAVELDGYKFHAEIRSRWLEDMEKHNEARIYGWVVLHVTPDMFRNGYADLMLNRLYVSRGLEWPQEPEIVEIFQTNT